MLSLIDKVILAPLAGINDIAFRLLCKNHGADIVYTGMVNSTALVRKNKATLRLIESCDEERPLAVQLFGYNEEIMATAAVIAEKSADIIDINMGCPDKDVVRQGAGAALLRRPAKVEKIIKAVKSKVKVPLTVKIRSGFEKHSIEETLKIAKIIEDAGADAVIVHPRTVKQGYSGKAEWGVIREVKQILKIPVIGNGDIRLYKDANEMKKITGCDSVMIGRAAMKNPEIFDEIKGKRAKGTRDEKLRLFREYLSYAKKYNILESAPLRIRAQMMLSGFSGSATLRRKIGQLKSDPDVIGFLERCFER